MDINGVFPSKYLKAADLKSREIKVTISHVKMEDVGDGDKPVVYFQGKERGVVLNKTNANNIAALYGPETDAWAGREVILYTAWVDFQGRSVEAIRVRPPTGQTMAQYQHQQAAQAQAPQQPWNPGPLPPPPNLDDEIPF